MFIIHNYFRFQIKLLNWRTYLILFTNQMQFHNEKVLFRTYTTFVLSHILKLQVSLRKLEYSLSSTETFGHSDGVFYFIERISRNKSNVEISIILLQNKTILENIVFQSQINPIPVLYKRKIAFYSTQSQSTLFQLKIRLMLLPANMLMNFPRVRR